MSKKLKLLNVFIMTLILQTPSQGSLVETEHRMNLFQSFQKRCNYYVAEYPEITLESPIFKNKHYTACAVPAIKTEEEIATLIDTSLTSMSTVFPSEVYRDNDSNHYIFASQFLLYKTVDSFPNDLTDRSLQGVLRYFGMTTFKGRQIEKDGYHAGLYQIYNPQIGIVKFELIPVFIGHSNSASATASNSVAARAASSPSIKYDPEEEQEAPDLD